ncbi:glycosyltransferase family 2 protein [Selenomonas ruminantium]|uniref:Glycosyltransferase involved in cell wall bisynthesis n=1 Tax=Selenomonas ruminantium TaxID=971 RepID=A0A1I0YKA1_SELRU|nr:glycosyltransferase family 2 protein [Selenomonas ruminantium]SFB13621.1 Glycosyltransferase involved in cell wall bisynthesis [Selenomonas ruminantium]
MVKISACVIVKNEAKNILRWLKCVKQIATEYIVVDTGSTDNTVELAEQNGAAVYHFAWCNDFAAAKNYALSKAGGDWIIFMDADEYFLSNDCEKVKQTIKKHSKSKVVSGFICKLINIDVDNNNSFINSVYQIRVFRNLPHLKFRGHVHEELVNSSGKKMKIEFMSAAVIYHTGYSRNIIKSKLERNLLLIKEKIAQRGEEAKDYFYLADCYSGLHDYDNTIYYARKALEANLKFVGMEGHVQENLLTALMLKDAPEQEVREAFEETLAQFPDSAKFALLKGIWLFDHKYYLAAEEWLQKGLDLKEMNDNAAEKDAEKLEMYGVQHLLPIVYQYMGDLSRLQKQLDKASEWYRKGLRENRYRKSLLRNFLSCQQELDAVELIQVLNEHYDKKDDADFLVAVLRNMHFGEVCLYYNQNTEKNKLTDTEKYFFAGNIKAAAEEQQQRMICQYHLIIWLLLRMQIPLVDNLRFSLLMPETMKGVWKSMVQGTELSPAGRITAQSVRNLQAALQS